MQTVGRGEAGPVGSLHMGEFQALSQRMGDPRGMTSSIVFCPAGPPHAPPTPKFSLLTFVFFWLRSKINLQDLQGTCTKKAAWAAWQYWTKRRALGSQGLTWNLWIKNLNAVSCGRWMDVISEMPAWFLALSETSEVFCTDSSDLETVCLAMLSSGKISCGCRALSSTGVICSSFLKAPQAGKGVLMKWWSWWWSVWDWPLQVG